MINGFDIDTVQKFSVVVRYDMEMFLQVYSYFLDNNQPNIERYFTEENYPPDANSFTALAQLIQEATKIANLIQIHSASFIQIDDWEFLEFFENIRTSLDSIDNTSKYSRSSKSQNSWQNSSSIPVSITLGEGQTLEEIQRKMFGGNFDDDWVNIALQNNMSEEDYGVNGGELVVVNKQTGSTPNFFLNSVVDNLIGEALYGLDYPEKMTFDTTANDVLILSYNDTVLQSINILTTMKMGDNPEFPNMGIDPRIVSGSNYNLFRNAQIGTQMEKLFATNDTLQNFSMISISYKNGDMFMTYSVGTFYNNVYNNKVTQIN